MLPTIVTSLGLILDIIGGFFLSIEAIGLDKLNSLHAHYLPRVLFQLNRRIVNIDGEPRLVGRSMKLNIGVDIATHIIGFLATVTIYVIMRHTIGDPLVIVLDSRNDLSWWIFLLVAATTLWITLSLFFGISFLAYWATLKMLSFGTWFLRLSVRRQVTGLAGVIGFAFMLAGFFLQLLGTLL